MVIEAEIKAQDLGGMSAFLCPACNPDHPAAFELTNLPYRCANRAGGGGHNQRFPCFWLTDIQQPHISSKSWHPHHSQRPGGMFRIIAKLHQPVTVGDVIVLPAAVAQHPLAWLVIRMVGGHHATHGPANHHAANLYRRRVRRLIAHASTHVGIEGKKNGAQQNLAFTRRYHLIVFKTEVFRDRRAMRAGSQYPAAIAISLLTHDVLLCFWHDSINSSSLCPPVS